MTIDDKIRDMILTKRQQKYQHYHLEKFINLNILHVKKYCLMIKEECRTGQKSFFPLGKGNLFFFVWAVGRTFSGWFVGRVKIIILSLRVGKSKNKNIDHRGKETCA